MTGFTTTGATVIGAIDAGWTVGAVVVVLGVVVAVLDPLGT